MPNIPKSSRTQIQFISYEEMIAKDNPVRVVDAFVDYIAYIGFEKLGFEVKGKKKEGRPAYQTEILLKLYIYGYLNRIRSSRQLAAACMMNIELFWLLHYNQPKYKTIADFRKNNKKALTNTFRQYNQFLKGEGLFKSDTVAIDGSKYRAQNSMKNNYNERKINQQLKYIDGQFSEYLEQMERLDNEECSQEESRIEVSNKLDELSERKKKYEDLSSKMDEALEQGETQISTSDPDARALPKKMNIVEVAYNVQTVVEADNKLIVNYEVSNKGDVYALSSLAIEAKKVLEKDKLKALADKGYDTGVELKTCALNNIETYVAPRKKNTSKKDQDFVKEKFDFDPDLDQYTCPAGKHLKSNGSWYKKNTGKRTKSYQVKRYKLPFSVCNACPFKLKCAGEANLSKSKGRPIERSEYEQYVKANRERVKLNKDLYRKRQQIVEHPFGTIKRQWGFSYTLLKGKEKVSGEFGLIHTCYNLRRSMSIFGVEDLIKRLKTALFTFLLFIASLKDQRLTILFDPPALSWTRS